MGKCDCEIILKEGIPLDLVGSLIFFILIQITKSLVTLKLICWLALVQDCRMDSPICYTQKGQNEGYSGVSFIVLLLYK